jgi:DNA-binding transcriptional ArsR family regulator
MATAKAAVRSAAKPAAVKSKKDDVLRQKKVQRAAILLKQASDPTRLQILALLASGERHVGSMCDELKQTQPAVSHHLALLRHGGLISPRRQGKNNFYSLTGTGESLAAVVKDLV